MKKILCILLSLVLLIGVCGCAKSNKEENKPSTEKDSVTFAIFSDMHIGLSDGHADRFTKGIDWANNYEPVEFVISLGDNVHNGRDASMVAKFDELAKDFKKPFYTLRGNHDHNAYDRNVYIDCGDVAIIAFYAELMWTTEKPYSSGWGVPQQDIEWIEEKLEQSRGKRVIFGCHIGIVQDNPNFNTWLETKAINEETGEVYLDFGREKILELAEKYNVELYFNGHEHNRDVPNGVAGTMIDFNLGSLGSDGVYMVVTVEKEKAVIEIRDINVDGIRRKLDYQFRFDIVK